MIRAHRNVSIITIGFLLVLSTISYSQTESKEKTVTPIKFDEVRDVDMCELDRRISKYFEGLFAKPDHQGYIINYGPDEEIANRERLITNRVAFRNFDRSRITLVRGGYLPITTTEFWLIPPNASYPELSESSTDSPPADSGTSLFKTRYLTLYPFTLEEIREKERPDFRSDGDDGSNGDVEKEKPNKDDARKDEDEEDPSYSWADVYIPFDLPAQKGSKIVIIFYADEHRYDIKAVTRFIQEGRDFLAKQIKVPKQRLVVEFGGYRQSPVAEFWFVPQNGKVPKASPDNICNNAGDDH